MQLGRIDDGVCTFWPALRVCATSPPASNSQEAKRRTTNWLWNEIVTLKNVCGFMHCLPRKVLEMYLYLQECHLKQKAESEVEICLKGFIWVDFYHICWRGCLLRLTSLVHFIAYSWKNNTIKNYSGKNTLRANIKCVQVKLKTQRAYFKTKKIPLIPFYPYPHLNPTF